MLHALDDPDVPAVTRIAHSTTWPRPRVGVFAAVHGNERCGLPVIERLRTEARAGRLDLRGGTLVLVHGNPEATRQDRRFTEGGVDLNRLFDFRFLLDLPERRWVSEHRRAAALRPVLEDLDVLLDIHSATRPTPPFAIVNEIPDALRLAKRLGFPYATLGWESPGLRMNRVTIGAMGRRERPGISVECGQHADPEAPRRAELCTLNLLRALELLDGTPADDRNVRVLQVAEVVARPSLGFRFTRPVVGLDRFEAGEVLARDRLTELRLREPCFVLMPNDGVPVGEDMAFLARPLSG
ncbi:MAG: succinylglutamate desuccinylase/aspartoacylase family protein [Sandaracinaceae bacterium]